MLINQITKKETEQLQKRFEAFDGMLENKQQALGYMKHDPSLFAYFFFRDDRGKRFKTLPWQDKFLNSKHKRRLLCCARQIGKSTTAGILALHAAYFNPGYTILVVSRTKDQAMEFVYRMRKFLNTSRFTIWQELQPRKNENKKEIILQSETKGIESRIIVVPCTDAALGYSANIVIGDEAARWENGDYVFREVIEPTTTWTEGDIYLLSTPAGKQGFFWQCYNLQDNWEVYQFDWHANPFLTKEYMDAKRKIHTSLSWAMNSDAKFVVSQNAYFTPMEIDGSINVESGLGYKGESPVVVGVDFGKVNDNCIIDIGCVLDPTKPKNEQVVRLLDRRVKPLGTDYAIILEELKAINLSMNHPHFVLDVTSGEVPSDFLKQAGCAVTPFKFTIQSKILLMNNLKVLMQQNRLQIPEARELRDQLEMFEYEVSEVNQDRMKLHAPEGKHDDEVDALALMCHGLTEGIGYLDSEFVGVTGTARSKSIQGDKVKELEKNFSSFLKKNSSNITY